MDDVCKNLPLILIAEDVDSNYLLFYYILKDNYQLIRAYNGQEAVELFQHHTPNLILMDIKMPRMDGYQATAQIRKISTTVPIIAITACAFKEDKEKILTSGFNAYLSKPINAILLKAVIEKFFK